MEIFKRQSTVTAMGTDFIGRLRAAKASHSIKTRAQAAPADAARRIIHRSLVEATTTPMSILEGPAEVTSEDDGIWESSEHSGYNNGARGGIEEPRI